MNAPPLRPYLLSWLALLGLLALTLGSAYVALGPFNLLINVGIGAAKALIVMSVFMQLRSGSPFIRLVAATGFIWLAVLAVLSLTDLLTQP